MEAFGAIKGFLPVEQEFGCTFRMVFQWQIREITLASVGLSGGDLCDIHTLGERKMAPTGIILFPYLPSSQQQNGAKTICCTVCFLLFHIQSSWGVFSPYQPLGIFTLTRFHWGLNLRWVISLNWFAWSSLIQIWPCLTSDFVRMKWASQHTFPERLLCSPCLQVTNTYQADNESPTNQRTASH